jgi:Phosphotransferase enzyme family
VSEERSLPEGHGGSVHHRSQRGVHRAVGPWSETVHAVLAHLERAGFDGAPRYLGLDESGREVLTYIDGDVLSAGVTWRLGEPTPWPEWAQSEDCLVSAASLLRSFHDAIATFVPPQGAMWRHHESPTLCVGEIVCHGDIGPHNTVYENGHPVAFIDWDSAGPSDPLVEFGRAAWHFVPLGTASYFEASDFSSTPDLPRRLALFSRAYGLDSPSDVAWALQQAQQRSVENLKYFPVTPSQAAEVLRIVAGQLAWLGKSLTALLSAF